QVRDVALDVHLRLLALRGGRQGHDAEHARAHAGRDGLDRTALAGAVAALEEDADLLLLAAHPFLKLDQLHVQVPQPVLVLSTLEVRCLRLDPLVVAVDGFPARPVPNLGLVHDGSPRCPDAGAISLGVPRETWPNRILARGT